MNTEARVTECVNIRRYLQSHDLIATFDSITMQSALQCILLSCIESRRNKERMKSGVKMVGAKEIEKSETSAICDLHELGK